MADSKKKSVSLAAFSPFLIVIAAVLFAGAAYFLLFFPKLRLIVKGGDLDLARIETLIGDEERRKAVLDSLEAKYKGLNPERKEKVQQMVPLEQDIPGLFVELDAIAQQNNFTLTSVDTTQDVKVTHTGGRKPTTIAANFSGGSFAYFAQLVRDIERSRRVLDVGSVVFTPNSGTYSLTMTAYNLDKEYATKGAAPSATVDGTADRESAIKLIESLPDGDEKK